MRCAVLLNFNIFLPICKENPRRNKFKIQMTGLTPLLRECVQMPVLLFTGIYLFTNIYRAQ